MKRREPAKKNRIASHRGECGEARGHQRKRNSGFQNTAAKGDCQVNELAHDFSSSPGKNLAAAAPTPIASPAPQQ